MMGDGVVPCGGRAQSFSVGAFQIRAVGEEISVIDGRGREHQLAQLHPEREKGHLDSRRPGKKSTRSCVSSSYIGDAHLDADAGVLLVERAHCGDDTCGGALSYALYVFDRTQPGPAGGTR